MSVRARFVCTALIALFAFPSFVHAQTKPEEPTHWGVSFTYVPKWTVPTGDSALAALASVAVAGADEGGANVEASDFRIGLVRGKRFGGEWGVSFVKRSYKDGSTQGAIQEECFQGGNNQTFCQMSGTEYTYENAVTMTAVEFNKFIAIATIKRLVQVGVDVAFGVGSMSGTAIKREADSNFVNGQPVTVITTESVLPSELYSFDPELIGRVEFVLGVTLPKGLKARFNMGLSYPGTQNFSFTFLYLFGKHE